MFDFANIWLETVTSVAYVTFTSVLRSGATETTSSHNQTLAPMYTFHASFSDRCPQSLSTCTLEMKGKEKSRNDQMNIYERRWDARLALVGDLLAGWQEKRSLATIALQVDFTNNVDHMDVENVTSYSCRRTS